MKFEQELKSQFVIPVIRHQDASDILSLCEALADGGLKVLEITLMSDAAYQVIKKLSLRSDLLIAAGTVLNDEQAKKAIDAGAKLLVSPGLNADAVNYALAHAVPFIPGVLTPTEIIQAHALGCEMVKVFPISSMGGISYIKNLQGPFPKMKFMATGGIEPVEIGDYKKSGVSCIGLGSHLTPKEKITARDWKGITSFVQELLKQV
jgi:2-dehydro-3-deoxyphosphogluconate aldolase/(4S)-4-hydroxy-2-oxoglutarate aldolase